MRVGTRIAIGFISAVVVVLLLGGLSWRGTSELVQTVRLVAHTHEVLGTAVVGFMASVVVLMLAAVLALTRSIARPLRARRITDEREELPAREQRAGQQAETANEKLRESEEHFRLIVESVVDYAIFTLDPKGIVTSWNLGAERTTGYRADEIVGQHCSRFYAEEEVSGGVCERELGEAARIGRLECEGWRLRKDGSRFWADVVITAVKDPKSGNHLYFSKVIRDLTKQKSAEEALRGAEQALQRSEQEFRSLTESLPQIVWATGADGLNFYFNQQWVDYTGLTLEESYGEGWITPFHPDDRQRAWDAWQRATRHRDTYSVECRLRRADGVYRWWLIRGLPLIGANGEISKWFGTCTDIEQIKATEQRLTESEAKSSGIVSISADAIISIDDEQRITIFNESAEKIFGYSRAEALGAPIEILIPERFRKSHQRLVAAFAAGRVTAHSMGDRRATIAGRRKNGEEFPAEAAISKLKVGDKTLLTVAIRDISERKRIEKALRDSNASLDAIIDNIPMMMFIKESKSLRFVRFNRAGEELLGWPKTSLVGKNDYDFWPKDQADFFIEKDRETLDRGTVVDIAEEEIQTRHQGVRILHTRKVPILDKAGNPIYLLGISDDITERKRIEKEQQFLAGAGALLSATLDYEQTLATVAQLAVRDFADWCIVEIVAEPEHLRRLKVVSADPTEAALCAYLEQAPIDRDRLHLLRVTVDPRKPLLVEHVSAEHLESVAQGPEYLRALRAARPVSMMALPLLRHGELLGTLAFISSTPSRIYGERDLRLAEALVDRAAVAIENARLYRASVQATQLRDQVLGVVAHDLRNPLSAIMMQASSLERQGPEPERRSQRQKEIIHRAATRMLRLIQDLLDVARMEQGVLPIKRARLIVGRLIADAVDMQRPLAASSSIDIRLDVRRDLPELSGDRDRLLQVFENLLGNAMKFTRTGGSITVGADSREHELVLWVADTGLGIAAENLPHIFDRFWQATRADRLGAGLGLPITKGIVEAHGGRIWVESTLGRGTTFFFSIPEAPSGGQAF